MYCVHFLAKRVWRKVYSVTGVGGGGAEGVFVVLCPLPGKARVAQAVQSEGGGGARVSVVLVVLCPFPGPVDVAQGGRSSSLAR